MTCCIWYGLALAVMQTADRPDVSGYNYRVTWSVEDGRFVAT